MSNQVNMLFPPLLECQSYRDLVKSIGDSSVNCVYGLDDASKAHLLSALQIQTGRPLLLIVNNEMAVNKYVQDLNQLLDGGVMALSGREISFLRTSATSRDLAMTRMHALGMAITGRLKALVMSSDSVQHRLMPHEVYTSHIIELHQDDVIEPFDLMDQLIAAGYERVDITEARGQCTLRGGILDIYPVGSDNAVRIEFFDDTIDSLRDFDVMTQRSITQRSSVEIFPATEILLTMAESKKAALHITELLTEANSSEGRKRRTSMTDRQKQLEEEYNLIPCDEFMQLLKKQDAMDNTPVPQGRGRKRKTSDSETSESSSPDASLDFSEEDSSAEDSSMQIQSPKKKTEQLSPAESHKESSDHNTIQHTLLGRNYASILDALENGQYSSGLLSLIHLVYPSTDTIVDYMNNPIIILDEPDQLQEHCNNRYLEFEELFKMALEREEALPAQAELLLPFENFQVMLNKGHSVILTTLFAHNIKGFTLDGLFKFESVAIAAYHNNIRQLVQDIQNWVKNNWRVVLFSSGTARGERLSHMLEEEGLTIPFLETAPETLEPGRPFVVSCFFSHGFQQRDVHLVVITESDIYGTSKHKAPNRKQAGEKISAFTDLHVGDLVVHENHGIGRYVGTIRLASEGTYRDYLNIQYQGNDKLFVPVDQLDRIQKYIGNEGAHPKLNRLSGNEWQKQKDKVQKIVQGLAQDLANLYAARIRGKGYAFSPDTPWQAEFESDFEFEETPDQLTAIQEIKADMEDSKIMDRLLCGDVGYGKTEVALRAVFKAVMDGKQAAMLAPTTILVQQHYNTMLKRFKNFPIRVGILSRFRTPTEQRATIQALERGEIDVVVGTHRLLGKDVHYKDLGLLVIDEEQRFGVRHKESIKQLKKNVDVLTLSATPIPRTLHMSMVGLRDMSLLLSPPEERYPVQTYVVEYSDSLIRDAILRELARHGQVYVLYNKVRSIDLMYERLCKLVPEARIVVGHGQMPEHALEDVMMDFYNGKFDVLICTTIIEAGLDVPNANTLIVCDADQFGLSQLYQLRGRVGRSNQIASAFLTVNPNKVLTGDANKRLEAIREFTEFGSGFRVSMKDLEIRGTGNLFGTEQSGSVSAIGYDLYAKMLEEALRNINSNGIELEPADIQTRIDLKVDAYLPTDYIPQDAMRIEIYKKIAQIRNQNDREDLIEELIDRFGEPGGSVLNLIDIAQLKSCCQNIGIELVTGKNGDNALRFSPLSHPDMAQLYNALLPYGNKVHFDAGRSVILHYYTPRMSPEASLRDLLKFLQNLSQEVV